jgi:hypothetical protein
MLIRPLQSQHYISNQLFYSCPTNSSSYIIIGIGIKKSTQACKYVLIEYWTVQRVVKSRNYGKCKPDHTDSQQHTHAAHAHAPPGGISTTTHTCRPRTHAPWRHTTKCPNSRPQTHTLRRPNYDSQHHNIVHMPPMHPCPLAAYPHIPKSPPTDMLPEAAKQQLTTPQQCSHATHAYVPSGGMSTYAPIAAYTRTPPGG